MSEVLSTTLPDDLEERVKTLLQRACDRSVTIATAESCTGGLLASMFTDVEGCSRAFDSGFVTYTDEAKIRMLGLPRQLLEENNAVCRPVAVAMAEGALDKSLADITVSTTGFAGPAGEDDEPGLVHFACARRGRETRHREEHFGDIGRGPTRIACLRTALDMLEEMMD